MNHIGHFLRNFGKLSLIEMDSPLQYIIQYVPPKTPKLLHLWCIYHTLWFLEDLIIHSHLGFINILYLRLPGPDGGSGTGQIFIISWLMRDKMYVRRTCEVCAFHLVLLAMADSSERVSRLQDLGRFASSLHANRCTSNFEPHTVG